MGDGRYSAFNLPNFNELQLAPQLLLRKRAASSSPFAPMLPLRPSFLLAPSSLTPPVPFSPSFHPVPSFPLLLSDPIPRIPSSLHLPPLFKRGSFKRDPKILTDSAPRQTMPEQTLSCFYCVPSAFFFTLSSDLTLCLVFEHSSSFSSSQLFLSHVVGVFYALCTMPCESSLLLPEVVVGQALDVLLLLHASPSFELIVIARSRSPSSLLYPCSYIRYREDGPKLGPSHQSSQGSNPDRTLHDRPLPPWPSICHTSSSTLFPFSPLSPRPTHLRATLPQLAQHGSGSMRDRPDLDALRHHNYRSVRRRRGRGVHCR
jgi:hypothetical protein